MSGKDLILDFSKFDVNHVVADLDEIRRWNPQRHEMEQLTAIVVEDTENKLCVGYRDYAPDEFWIRGHMPGNAVLPGVLMCEAAAQLCSYFALKHKLMETDILGFGGMESVRFRGMVLPTDRLVMMVALVKLRPKAMCVSRFQGFVRQSLVCEGEIWGVPLPSERITAASRLAR